MARVMARIVAKVEDKRARVMARIVAKVENKGNG